MVVYIYMPFIFVSYVDRCKYIWKIRIADVDYHQIQISSYLLLWELFKKVFWLCRTRKQVHMIAHKKHTIMHVEHKGNNGSLHYLYHIHCETPYLFHDEIHCTGIWMAFYYSRYTTHLEGSYRKRKIKKGKSRMKEFLTTDFSKERINISW